MTLPTIYYLSQFKVDHFFKVIFGFLFLFSFYLLYLGVNLNFDRDAFSYFFNPVISYDIGFISLSIILLCYSFYDRTKLSYLYLFFSLVVMFLLILHGSRGTWVGLPFVFFGLIFFYYKTQIKKIFIMIALVLIFTLTNLMLPNSPILKRVDNLQEDTLQITNNNYQNSSGLRLYMWKNAISYFKSSPIFGVGLYEIEAKNCELNKQGKLPTCFQHLHSIYFNELAAHGLFGIFGLFLTFFSSLIFFIKNIFNKEGLIKNISISGCVFVVYYMFCGLTEYYLFFLNTTYLFYWIVASLMSFIIIGSRVSIAKKL
ncbi:O-antigen ligase family protein [Acinetobacter nectaris]|uniref:O-antigen ligase family protein n=1 Tax=Acinetobacter nectaris TaxID=1219382 RepID=UPI001F3C20EA|nr:O-antigen ligase family protein [Acinetobacter nectaris]